MNVLVTGANGLLGHHVVIELLKRNHHVKIIVRSANAIYFDLSNVELHIGNFTNMDELVNAAQHCEAIIHIAALTATNLLNYDSYHKINVEGVKTILKVADLLTINKLVYVSSANTIGFGNEQHLADECLTIEYPFSASFYAQSKVVSEKLVIDASQKVNRHFVIINPTFMIGEMDTKPSSGKLMLLGYRKKLMLAPGGGKNFVPVKDVAFAVCNALFMGKNGQRYLAAGVNLSFVQFYRMQSEIAGYNQRIEVFPSFLLEVVAKIGDLIRRFGIQTDVCSMNINQLLIQEYYINSKATLELDMPETDLKQAIQEALKWFKDTHVIC